MKNKEIARCCVCNEECIEDTDCNDCWVCPNAKCSVHEEER